MTARSFNDLVRDYLSMLDANGRRLLAEFLDVQDQTIRCWTRGATVPSGVRIVKMHYLLEEAGFNDETWRCVNPVLIDAGRMVAFGLIDVDDIVNRINQKSVNRTRLVQFLCGHDHAKQEVVDVIESMVAIRESDYKQARQRWDGLCIRNDHSRLIAELANRIRSMLPLCEDMASDDWTPEERQELRKRCGKDTVFGLYNALGSLCGEQARQHQFKNGKVAAMIRRAK